MRDRGACASLAESITKNIVACRCELHFGPPDTGGSCAWRSSGKSRPKLGRFLRPSFCRWPRWWRLRRSGRCTAAAPATVTEAAPGARRGRAARRRPERAERPPERVAAAAAARPESVEAARAAAPGGSAGRHGHRRHAGHGRRARRRRRAGDGRRRDQLHDPAGSVAAHRLGVRHRQPGPDHERRRQRDGAAGDHARGAQRGGGRHHPGGDLRQGVLPPGTVVIGSNKTVVGLCGAEVHGHVDVSNVSNVIIRNLKIVGYGVGNCALDPSFDATVGCSSGDDAMTDPEQLASHLGRPLRHLRRDRRQPRHHQRLGLRHDLLDQVPLHAAHRQRRQRLDRRQRPPLLEPDRLGRQRHHRRRQAERHLAPRLVGRQRERAHAAHALRPDPRVQQPVHVGGRQLLHELGDP